MDLDDFKFVNDSPGHKAGDELLVDVADRLRTSLRPEDTVARLGGDEFAVLLENVTDVGEATQVAERIAYQLRFPFELAERERLSRRASALNSVELETRIRSPRS
jgi:diguanylate cyclase (GGDEF)-like protein